MNRIIDYIVPPLSSPMRISTWLRSLGYSRQNLIELKKHPGCVSTDGKGRYFNERLLGGEKLRVVIPVDHDPHLVPVRLPFGIVYEDEDIIVVNKPAGMPVHPSHNNRENTLANALAYYYRSRGEAFVFRCSNRLDRDTSGLTVAARHIVSGNILSVMGTQRKIKREYLGIVRGIPSPPEGTIDAPLAREEGSILKRRVDFENGEPAITHYRTVSSFVPAPGTDEKKCSLVSLTLETGRTHQIRVHLKYAGFPLIGDYLYNPDMELISRQALHCAGLSFRHPVTGKALSFEAPLPPDMQRLLSNSRTCPPVLRDEG